MLKDADILTSKGSHARACALTILAFEEYAKAFLYRMLELGFASYDCDASGSWPPLRLCHHVMTDHKSKHAVIRAALMGLKMLPDGFRRNTAENGVNVTETVTEADTQMNNFLDEARAVKTSEDRERFKAKNSQLASDLTQITARVKRWEDLKERALYVDIENGRLVEPSLTITSGSVTEIRKSLDEWLAVNESFVTGPIPEGKGLNLSEVLRTLKIVSSIQSLPPWLILCERCERDRHKLSARQTLGEPYPKGSENGSPES